MLPRLACAAATVLALACAPAVAAVTVNPAEGLLDRPIEESRYDPATHCSAKRRPGMVAFERWLGANARGQSWGVYRCERWGKRSASLHAEGRAIDWHLDIGRRGDRREARRLIALMLAPDSAGNEQALARRMGVEEIIWNCKYWAAGMARKVRYRACLTKRGRVRKRVDPTVAHRNHVHFGMTRAGAAGRTSFWSDR